MYFCALLSMSPFYSCVATGMYGADEIRSQMVEFVIYSIALMLNVVAVSKNIGLFLRVQ